MKTCTKCGIEKETTGFSKSRRNPDGLQPYCKSCQAVLHKSWQENKYRTDIEFKNKMVASLRTGYTCSLIRKHHNEMKDDPEHLTTEFIQGLLGTKCNKELEKSDELGKKLREQGWL